MTDPVDFTISRHSEPGLARVIRIEARDHQKLLVRLEISPDDFLAAALDGQTVTAAFSSGRAG